MIIILLSHCSATLRATLNWSSTAKKSVTAVLHLSLQQLLLLASSIEYGEKLVSRFDWTNEPSIGNTVPLFSLCDRTDDEGRCSVNGGDGDLSDCHTLWGGIEGGRAGFAIGSAPFLHHVNHRHHLDTRRCCTKCLCCGLTRKCADNEVML